MVWALRRGARAGRHRHPRRPPHAARCRPSLTALRDVRRERWTRHRGIAVTGALVGFYVTYVAYRNLKTVVPLLRPDELYDKELTHVDSIVFGFGKEPWEILHASWAPASRRRSCRASTCRSSSCCRCRSRSRSCSPPTCAAACSSRPRWRSTGRSAPSSYLLLPARGPIYYVPQDFADLPHSHAAYLQERLLVERREFLSDPQAAEVGQNIAAFASLHCSLLFTAALAAHLLGLHRTLRIALWVLFVVSAISTVHLGWHYVIDDVAGIAIALLALGIACYMTGFQGRPRSRAQ